MSHIFPYLCMYIYHFVPFSGLPVLAIIVKSSTVFSLYVIVMMMEAANSLQIVCWICIKIFRYVHVALTRPCNTHLVVEL